MTDQLSPEQRAEALAAEYYGPEYEASHLRRMVSSAIRAAETAAVSRCVEALLGMGMHETALMLRAALKEANNHG